MTRIVIDSLLRNKLLGLNSPLELCDDSGQVLALLTPVERRAEHIPSEPQISREELRRRATSSERRYSTEEVLKYLESL
ncbi:MAG: hypothetical protein B7Z73_07470 [Planctomycetia bacterium 21-64-5]|nr:MAG: hypothetical protein B7Z73_07470 [Planctomycetia bacterium 21-64-5]HQU44726.1 hypothetical protein [Pirellulales bacterium]